MHLPVIETEALPWKGSMLPLHQGVYGEWGHRSPCLTHAKRALYHLS